MGSLANDCGRLVDLEQGHARAAGHIEKHTTGTVDRDVQQLARDRLLGCLFGPLFARAYTYCHERSPAFGHDRTHVCKIEVDQSGNGDELRDTLYALVQNIIGQAERVLQTGSFICDLQQAIVGDGDERVGVFFEFADARVG